MKVFLKFLGVFLTPFFIIYFIGASAAAIINVDLGYFLLPEWHPAGRLFLALIGTVFGVILVICYANDY